MDYTKLFNDKAKQVHLELSLKGEAENAGLIPLNNAPPESTEWEIREKKKREHTYELMLLLTQAREILQEFIDEMDLALIEARRELLRYQDMADERKSLEHCIETLKNGEILERNPDGTLKDKHLQKAIEHYAKDHNLNTDFSDDAYVLALAGNAIQTYPSAKQLEQVTVLQTKKINIIEKGRDDAFMLKNQLDNPDSLSADDILEKANKFDVLKNDTYEKLQKTDERISNALKSDNETQLHSRISQQVIVNIPAL